ncbi:uncharacterized protein LOC118427997 [Branchiostoma floridae]|uniref:Uncharacterized protein LOC118427997 n=1 Tax=Branchiostoma floridae TaxID=7739 RepID=A0A9J7M5P8_BRAFL|nr:uncharacterized protein LOC118427997 [Branchiostoma floridae]
MRKRATSRVKQVHGVSAICAIVNITRRFRQEKWVQRCLKPSEVIVTELFLAKAVVKAKCGQRSCVSVNISGEQPDISRWLGARGPEGSDGSLSVRDGIGVRERRHGPVKFTHVTAVRFKYHQLTSPTSLDLLASVAVMALG